MEHLTVNGMGFGSSVCDGISVYSKWASITGSSALISHLMDKRSEGQKVHSSEDYLLHVKYSVTDELDVVILLVEVEIPKNGATVVFDARGRKGVRETLGRTFYYLTEDECSFIQSVLYDAELAISKRAEVMTS